MSEIPMHSHWEVRIIVIKRDIYCFDFLSYLFCFNFFSDKYCKRNVPTAIPQTFITDSSIHQGFVSCRDFTITVLFQTLRLIDT